MRSAALWLLVCAAAASACRSDDASPSAIDAPTDEPQVCRDHCVVDEPPATWQDCCDSTTCYVDHDTGAWHVVYCDPPPPDPCAACLADEICVARYDGTCTGGPACVPRTVDCPDNACSPACEAAYCPSPYQCEDRVPCGGESPLAFTCYGP